MASRWRDVSLLKNANLNRLLNPDRAKNRTTQSDKSDGFTQIVRLRATNQTVLLTIDGHHFA